MEWQAFQELLCPGCKQPRDESMAKDGPHYEAEPLRCRACEARVHMERKFTEDQGSVGAGDTAGLMVSVRPVED